MAEAKNMSAKTATAPLGSNLKQTTLLLVATAALMIGSFTKPRRGTAHGAV
jgi:hypothetical protein